MGRASTYSDAAGSPQTCCTTCRTVFEVSPELLSASDTRVRCGECLSIFDALANLRDPEEEIEALAEVPEEAFEEAFEEAPAEAVPEEVTEQSPEEPQKEPQEEPQEEPREGIPDEAAADEAPVGEPSSGRTPAPAFGISDRKPVASGKAPTGLDQGVTPTAHELAEHDLSADEAELAGIDSPADETGTLDVTYSDFDLFSGDAQLPEVAYLDETTDTPEFDFDTVDVDADETFSDTLFAHDATIEPDALADATDVGATAAFDEDDLPSDDTSASAPGPDPDFVDDDEPVEPLVFRYRDAEESGSDRRAGRKAGATAEVIAGAGRGAGANVDTGSGTEPVTDESSTRATAGDASVGAGPATGAGTDGSMAVPTPNLGEKYASPPPPRTPWLLRSLLLLVLGGLLIGLYAYRERDSLHDDPLTRPVLLAACRAVGCTVPSRVDLASLKLIERKVFTHPTESDALVINVTFRNTATFDQRYPVLVVRLRDRLGRIVAERDFAPSDYLESWASGDTIEATRNLSISLEVDDPGDGAESYEFEFREAAG